MVAPKAIDAMQCYLDKYLLKPIIKDITLYIVDKMAETNDNKKAFRIVQVEKLKSFIQKYVSHDITQSTPPDEGDAVTVPSRKKDSKCAQQHEFAFHQLTFRKHVTNLT